MAKYKLSCPAFINGIYYSPRDGDGTVNIPDDVVPSETFTPLDEAANESFRRKENAPLPKAARATRPRAVAGTVRSADADAQVDAGAEAGVSGEASE